MAKGNLNKQVGGRGLGGIGAFSLPIHAISFFFCKYMYCKGKCQVLVAEDGLIGNITIRAVASGRTRIRKMSKKGLPGVALLSFDADLIFLFSV